MDQRCSAASGVPGNPRNHDGRGISGLVPAKRSDPRVRITSTARGMLVTRAGAPSLVPLCVDTTKPGGFTMAQLAELAHAARADHRVGGRRTAPRPRGVSLGPRGCATTRHDAPRTGP